MHQRHQGVGQRHGQNGVHAVLDDVLLSFASQVNDKGREGEDGQQFHEHITCLRRTRCSKCVQFTHIVVGSNVHGERDGGDEHARHAGHPSPLFSHQGAQPFAVAKFILHG